MDIYLPIADITVFMPFILGIAFVVGVISGFLGIGGGFILNPIMVFLGVPSIVAVGSGVSQVLATSGYAVSHYHKKKIIPYRASIVFVIGGLIGVLVGVKTLNYLSVFYNLDAIMRWAFLGLLCCVFLLLILPSPAEENHKCPTQIATKQIIQFLMIGMIIGFISGVMGISGGILVVPAFIYFLHLSRKNAQILSQVNSFFVAFIGLILHFFMNNNIDPILCSLLITGGFGGSYVGVKLSHSVSTKLNHYLFMVVILSTIIMILYDLIR